MKIDQELADAIAELDRKRRERKEAARLSAENERRRLEAVSLDRQARHDELWSYAEAALKWREDFLRSTETQRIWEILGDHERLPLFFAKFWRGEPCPPGDIATCAVITLDDLWHYFHYEERHKGQVSFKSPRLMTPSDLVERLHPDLLKQLSEHLAGPAALAQVTAFLKCLAARS